MFWVREPIIDFTINHLEKIEDVFVVDVMQCYENIPIEGKDNLIFTMFFFVKNAFQQYHYNTIDYNIFFRLKLN
jgi:hypothetical protein